ncbi:MAG: response regulator [Hylemonella sp.]|nr:response regulator [Hylemonella sp.]
MEPTPKQTVLLIDDDGIIRAVLKSILRGEGYRVLEEASNGEAGVAMCARYLPDLVLLDINLPKMSGLEVLEQIREKSPKSVVLMVSGEITKQSIDEAMKKGAAGFMVKPITAASLLAKVARCLDAGKGS